MGLKRGSRTRSPQQLLDALTSGYEGSVSAVKEMKRRWNRDGVELVHAVADLAVTRGERLVGAYVLPLLVDGLTAEQVLEAKYDTLVFPWNDTESLHAVLRKIPNDRRTAIFRDYYTEALADPKRNPSIYNFEYDHLGMVPDLVPWLLEHYWIRHRNEPHAPLECDSYDEWRRKVPSIDAALRAHEAKVGPLPEHEPPPPPPPSRFTFTSVGTAYGAKELDALTGCERAQFLIAAGRETGATYERPGDYPQDAASKTDDNPELYGVERFGVDGGDRPWQLWYFPHTDDGSLFVRGTTEPVPIVLVHGVFQAHDKRWTGGRALSATDRASLEPLCTELGTAFTFRDA